MPTRKATAIWKGTIKDGSGTMKTESGAVDGKYSFATRFEDGTGTNPEELLGAASAGCFSMAFSLMLTEKGYNPTKIETVAEVAIKNAGGDISIPTIALNCSAVIPGIEDAEFQQIAENARAHCPVSKALSGVKISLDATLEG
ncbi:OsmC family protein [Bradymonas sediminis]|uniref:Peroxiredoxin n=1 Tax=Bradymonas sediminis TaxID=1548548 RepID=A0A2Z4FMD0_9DELT|nr:OsmC family protein [Bradymonas sediminis]AWV89990.1 peroxiredoxin [Bradymonas sediminis]TDP76054.1 osmotically inducible protein OsmC [Bradymonas sediminis]